MIMVTQVNTVFNMSVVKVMKNVVKILLNGGIRWRSALEEELALCHAARQNLQDYRTQNRLRRVLHSVLEYIGLGNLVRYEEPTLSPCEGTLVDLARNILGSAEKEEVLRLVDRYVFWPKMALLFGAAGFGFFYFLRRFCGNNGKEAVREELLQNHITEIEGETIQEKTEIFLPAEEVFQEELKDGIVLPAEEQRDKQDLTLGDEKEQLLEEEENGEEDNALPLEEQLDDPGLPQGGEEEQEEKEDEEEEEKVEKKEYLKEQEKEEEEEEETVEKPDELEEEETVEKPDELEEEENEEEESVLPFEEHRFENDLPKEETREVSRIEEGGFANAPEKDLAAEKVVHEKRILKWIRSDLYEFDISRLEWWILNHHHRRDVVELTTFYNVKLLFPDRGQQGIGVLEGGAHRVHLALDHIQEILNEFKSEMDYDEVQRESLILPPEEEISVQDVQDVPVKQTFAEMIKKKERKDQSGRIFNYRIVKRKHVADTQEEDEMLFWEEQAELWNEEILAGEYEMLGECQKTSRCKVITGVRFVSDQEDDDQDIMTILTPKNKILVEEAAKQD